MFFYRTMWYIISQNFNSLRCLVLVIPSFEFDDYRGFRASAGVHKLSVGGVLLIDGFILPNCGTNQHYSSAVPWVSRLVKSSSTRLFVQQLAKLFRLTKNTIKAPNFWPFVYGRDRPANGGSLTHDQSRGSAWWRHQMETFSALLVICVRNSLVPGEFPAQRQVMRSFDVFYDLRLNKRLSKQSWGWGFETLSRPLWRHCNGFHGISSHVPCKHIITSETGVVVTEAPFGNFSVSKIFELA